MSVAGITVYFPITTIVLSCTLGLFFFGWWLRRKEYLFLFFWSVGFGLLFLFKAPSSILHAGMQSLLNDNLNLFFFVSLSAYFVAHLCLIVGLLFYRNRGHYRTLFVLFLLYLVLCVGYFFATFFGGGEYSYAPVWLSNAIFFIPAQIIICYQLWCLLHDVDAPRGVRLFVVLGIVGALLLVAASLMYIIVQLNIKNPEQWLSASIFTWQVSFVQVLSIIAFFSGLAGLSRARLKGSGA